MKWRWALRGNFWFDAIRATERHCAVEDELLRRSAHAAHMCATYYLPLTTYYLLLTTCYLLLTPYYLLLDTCHKGSAYSRPSPKRW